MNLDTSADLISLVMLGCFALAIFLIYYDWGNRNDD